MQLGLTPAGDRMAKCKRKKSGCTSFIPPPLPTSRRKGRRPWRVRTCGFGYRKPNTSSDTFSPFAELARAALAHEQAVCLLEAAGREEEASLHRISAASC